jgi:hypothetical protein
MNNTKNPIQIPEFESATIGVGEKIEGPSVMVYSKQEIMSIISNDYSEEGLEELFKVILGSYKNYDPNYLPIFLTENWRI